MSEHDDYRRREADGHAAMLGFWLYDDLRNNGENRLGIEFKYDHLFRDTGNLYIEIAEKAHPRAGDYAPSGVFRNDNTKLWVQGDREGVAVFQKADLAREAANGYRRVTNARRTPQGYLLPNDMAANLALWTVRATEVPAEDALSAVRVLARRFSLSQIRVALDEIEDAKPREE
jgi:hypothetical protein